MLKTVSAIGARTRVRGRLLTVDLGLGSDSVLDSAISSLALACACVPIW